jgi:hypothetical protein
LNFKRDSDDLFNKTTQIKTKKRMINYYFCPEQIAQVLFHEFKNISIQRTLDDQNDTLFFKLNLSLDTMKNNMPPILTFSHGRRNSLSWKLVIKSSVARSQN